MTIISIAYSVCNPCYVRDNPETIHCELIIRFTSGRDNNGENDVDTRTNSKGYQ